MLNTPPTYFPGASGKHLKGIQQCDLPGDAGEQQCNWWGEQWTSPWYWLWGGTKMSPQESLLWEMQPCTQHCIWGVKWGINSCPPGISLRADTAYLWRQGDEWDPRVPMPPLPQALNEFATPLQQGLAQLCSPSPHQVWSLTAYLLFLLAKLQDSDLSSPF